MNGVQIEGHYLIIHYSQATAPLKIYVTLKVI